MTTPESKCPQCGKEYDDFDGFGVVYCKECGYCKHVSETNGKCDYCGKTTPNEEVIKIVDKFIYQSCVEVGTDEEKELMKKIFNDKELSITRNALIKLVSQSLQKRDEAVRKEKDKEWREKIEMWWNILEDNCIIKSKKLNKKTTKHGKLLDQLLNDK